MEHWQRKLEAFQAFVWFDFFDTRRLPDGVLVEWTKVRMICFLFWGRYVNPRENAWRMHLSRIEIQTHDHRDQSSWSMRYWTRYDRCRMYQVHILNQFLRSGSFRSCCVRAFWLVRTWTTYANLILLASLNFLAKKWLPDATISYFLSL